MIQFSINGRDIMDFGTWEEVMAYFHELLGHFPKGKMRVDILRGREITLGGNRYRATVEREELAAV